MSYENEHNYYNNENDGYRPSYNAAPNPFEHTPKQKKNGTGRVIALALCCALIGGGAGVGGAALYMQNQSAGNSSVIYQSDRTPAETMINNNSGNPMTPSQLYDANLASCVGITTSVTTTNVFGQLSTGAASGSGFVLTQDGYIVTNYHVIADATTAGQNTIDVSFADGASYPATLVGYEADNDIAILKIEATGLTPVTLGNSDYMEVGETVMAIGNPLGELTYTLTTGIVSATDRLISTEESSSMNMLQTNCAINPGNSGGPLFNSYGEVIGITTAKYTTSSSGTNVEGLGFAIPINDVAQMFKDLIDFGYVTGKPYMGVQVSNVSDEAQRYGVAAGAAIVYVAPDSCAEKSGLQVGDIVTAIDDTAIDSSAALTSALTGYKAGESASLTVVRQSETISLSITFDEKNDETESANQPTQEPQQPQQQRPENYPQSPFDYFFQW